MDDTHEFTLYNLYKVNHTKRGQRQYIGHSIKSSVYAGETIVAHIRLQTKPRDIFKNE